MTSSPPVIDQSKADEMRDAVAKLYTPWKDRKHKPKRRHKSFEDSILRNKNSERISNVRSDDVLFGRGRAYQNHPGNQRMRAIVYKYKEQYEKVHRSRKREVVEAVYSEITQHGARFLYKSSQDNDDSYTIVNLPTALQKVRNTLGAKLSLKDQTFLKKILMGGEQLPAASNTATGSTTKTPTAKVINMTNKDTFSVNGGGGTVTTAEKRNALLTNNTTSSLLLQGESNKEAVAPAPAWASGLHNHPSPPLSLLGNIIPQQQQQQQQQQHQHSLLLPSSFSSSVVIPTPSSSEQQQQQLLMANLLSGASTIGGNNTNNGSLAAEAAFLLGQQQVIPDPTRTTRTITNTMGSLLEGGGHHQFLPPRTSTRLLSSSQLLMDPRSSSLFGSSTSLPLLPSPIFLQQEEEERRQRQLLAEAVLMAATTTTTTTTRPPSAEGGRGSPAPAPSSHLNFFY